MTITGLDYTIKKVSNGFVVKKSWMEKNDKDEFTSYQDETHIFTDYYQVMAFLGDAEF